MTSNFTFGNYSRVRHMMFSCEQVIIDEGVFCSLSLNRNTKEKFYINGKS